MKKTFIALLTGCLTLVVGYSVGMELSPEMKSRAVESLEILESGGGIGEAELDDLLSTVCYCRADLPGMSYDTKSETLQECLRSRLRRKNTSIPKWAFDPENPTAAFDMSNASLSDLAWINHMLFAICRTSGLHRLNELTFQDKLLRLTECMVTVPQ